MGQSSVRPRNVLTADIRHAALRDQPGRMTFNDALQAFQELRLRQAWRDRVEELDHRDAGLLLPVFALPAQAQIDAVAAVVALARFAKAFFSQEAIAIRYLGQLEII